MAEPSDFFWRKPSDKKIKQKLDSALLDAVILNPFLFCLKHRIFKQFV
jgi:hypothetical protein